jgi:acetyl-CoA/propionyl-CoA carboxylase biotin carboxyl carrier protein
MSNRVLVANRGEIAVRVIRACHDLGWPAVAVYDPTEADAMHVRLADAAYRLDSELPIPYLDVDALIQIARRADCQYVHPGYGFLAENAVFATACADAGLMFVGPSPEAIRTMGDKVAARSAAAAAGVPILPGTIDPVTSAKDASKWADENGYPAALKAAAGGGGRGFRVARSAAQISDAFASATSEAERAFGDGRLYIERYLDRPRHVEIQVLADTRGHVVALGDRDCSIQRRHQKLLEEAPAPGLGDGLRAEMAAAAMRLTRQVGYVSAGTLEFLVEPAGRFWFLEMNTRIQVEHTVTEEVFGVDLVREQLRIASGEALSIQTDACPRGHSIQFRINAEDPGRNFSPAPGTITRFASPLGPGVRVDTACSDGTVISPRYDSLIAKLVVTGANREEAIQRGIRALGEMVVEGVPTTRELHQNILGNERFVRADLSTAFLNEEPGVIPAPAVSAETTSLDEPDGWSERVIEINGRRFTVRVPEQVASRSAGSDRKKRERIRAHTSSGAADGPTLPSPFQGSVLRIGRQVGEAVAAGDPVLVVEAMKMENDVRAHRSGTLIAISPTVGTSVRVGDPLFTIE